AMTGVFNGNLRFVGNYRQQWAQVTPFTTMAGSVDFSMLRGNRNGNFAGSGLQFYNDVAGEFNELVTNSFSLSGSYIKRLNQKPSHYLSIGTQVGFINRQFNLGNPALKPTWHNDYGVVDPVVNSNAYSIGYIDAAAGVLWFASWPSMDAYAGFSVFHVNSPAQKTGGVDIDNLHTKTAVHGGLEYKITNVLSLMPTMLILVQGPSQEINFGSYLKRKFDPTGNVAIYAGMWTRIVGSAKPQFAGAEAL
ncbi:MAG: PorP/SprF family type IX secretion system membrane protein, partial [Bacteroidetes bacterium]|nr:PorP/SprF family type IX secretion system membrane protein [Bacteroidota bacterium]